MRKKTVHENYLEEQLKDPEFRAHYTLAREKTRIEFMLEDLLTQLKQDTDKKVIIKNLRKINNYISKIAL